MAVAQTTVRRVGAAARRLEADICVVGSGAAGLSAALESARLGRRTILVDASPKGWIGRIFLKHFPDGGILA